MNDTLLRKVVDRLANTADSQGCSADLTVVNRPLMDLAGYLGKNPEKQAKDLRFFRCLECTATNWCKVGEDIAMKDPACECDSHFEEVSVEEFLSL